jgi:hypothetical protein
VHFDLASAPRANGIAIDWVDNGVRGAGLSITNPNAPAQLRPLSVKDLAARLAEFTVIDVRPPQARALAAFPSSHAVLDETTHDDLAALPKDTKLQQQPAGRRAFPRPRLHAGLQRRRRHRRLVDRRRRLGAPLLRRTTRRVQCARIIVNPRQRRARRARSTLPFMARVEFLR